MNFHESVSHALYSRVEDGKGLDAPLVEGAAYMEQMNALKAAVKANDEAGVIAAARRMCDLHSQYFYRVGLQDGVRLMAEDFPVRGIDLA